MWLQICTLCIRYQKVEILNLQSHINLNTYTKQVNPKILLQNYTHCTHGRMRFKCIKIPNADSSQLQARSLITYFYGLWRTYYYGLCTKNSTSCRGNNEQQYFVVFTNKIYKEFSFSFSSFHFCIFLLITYLLILFWNQIINVIKIFPNKIILKI